MIATGRESPLKGKSFLLSPPPDLSACVFAAVVRDTRGVDLCDLDRFNFFPASPLVALTRVVEGEIRFARPGDDLAALGKAPPLPGIFVTPPQNTPTMSWSSGPILAVTVGLYPDARARLADRFDLVGELAGAFEGGDDVHSRWNRFCASLSPAWEAARGGTVLASWTGASRVSDWARALIARAILSGPGSSVRSVERRLRRWSGLTRQTLGYYAGIEDLHRLATKARERPLAELALEAGYSDQSHMGRAVRRATGFSPAQLNHLIQTEEAFWYYRLAGERF